MRTCTAAIILIACAAFLLTADAAWAQKTILGTVTDAESGEALPVAHIRIEGRLQGTITNAQGEFDITVGELPAELYVSYIGYHSRRIAITGSSPDTLAVALERNPVVMEEIVVTPEDPAVGIMREVIRRKQEWRASLENWEADAYTRSSLANDERIALIAESISKVYWREGHGTEETIISKRQTKNIGIEDNFAQARIMPNLYDDDIELIGFDMIGITHPEALDYYDFELTGRRMRDDTVVYDIAVTPKKKLQPSFTGTLSVLGGDYAMIAVDVHPNDAVRFPPPLNNFDVTLRQQFDNFGGDSWLPVDVQIGGRLKLKLPGLDFPPMNYRQMTRLTGYEVNTVVPDSLFVEKERTVTVKAEATSGSATLSVGVGEKPVERDRGGRTPPASQQPDASGTPSTATGTPSDEGKSPETTPGAEADVDSIFAASPLVVPFDEEEERAYADIDSTDNPGRAFRPSGFLGDMIDDGEQPPEPKERSRFGRALSAVMEPFGPRFAFNRVDGAALGVSFSRDLWWNLALSAGGTYRTGPEDWAHDAGIDWRWNDNGILGADYSVGTAVQGGSSRFPTLFTSIYSLAGGRDYRDYYHNERWGVRAEYDVRRFDTSVVLRYDDEDHSAIGQVTDDALFGSRGPVRPNSPVPNATLRSVTLSLGHGSGDAPFGIAGTRRMAFDVEVSDPAVFGGDYSFARYAAEVDWRFETFLGRRFLPMALDVRVAGGYTDGDTVPERFGVLDGTLGVFSPFGGFRTMPNRPMEGKHYAAVFWEHTFRTVPFELAGLDWFADKGITLILHGASGRTWRGDLPPGGWTYARDEIRHEAGLSVSGLFGLLRADVTKRLDRGGWYAGCGLGRLF